MAGGGGGDDEENPVPVNCVALIDIIFCLCLFFMCSLHFKQLEGKLESWLPKDKGVHAVPVTNPVLEEMRVTLKWNGTAVETSYGKAEVSSDEDLRGLLVSSHQEYLDKGKPDIPVIIEAQPRVPWKAVINIMNICARAKIDKIEFAAPGKS